MEYTKEVKINKNRILRFEISEGYVPLYTINEILLNGTDIKDYRLSRWDDYGFNAWQDPMDNKQRIAFEFEKNHPLYIPFFHLLREDNELIIDDDDTAEDEKKYMKISKKEDRIIVEFINQLEKDDLDRFNVFIKNIMYDGRSKVNQLGKDTKERLYWFFQEVSNYFMEENHQISIEEYLIQSNQMTEEESKKYLKKIDTKAF